MLGLLLIGLNAFAQQNSQFTQYMYNTAVINPAYAGSREVLSIVGLNRMQWVGMDGAPRVLTFAANSAVSDHVGLGTSIVSDKIGPSNQTSLSVDMSYNIRLNYDYKLFFGLKASGYLLNIDYTKLNQYNPNDPHFQNNISGKFSPNLGTGVYLQSDRTYVGVSVPALLENILYDANKESALKLRSHYYFMAGHVFDLSYNVKFKPAILADFIVGSPLQLNLSANFLFFEKLTLGTSYRWGAAASAVVGFQITDGLLMGYAYDADTNKLGKYNSGSHEFFLRFELSKKINKVFSPRIFLSYESKNTQLGDLIFRYSILRFFSGKQNKKSQQKIRRPSLHRRNRDL